MVMDGHEDEYCDGCGRALPYYQIRNDDATRDCPHCDWSEADDD